LHTLCGLDVFSIDSYQSAQLVQAWRKAGILPGRVSCDDSIEPYTMVKTGYKDKRIIAPFHEIYSTEITSLQFDGKKFEHPAKGSKDVSDAAAGCVYLLETHMADASESGGGRGGQSVRRPGRRVTRRRYVR
jgi:hypothetical protein